MANQNDDKIKALLQSIEDKKSKMGTKPRAVWQTNGVIGEKNLNTISSIDVCVELAAQLMGRRDSIAEACRYLGVSRDVKDIEEALADLKLRVQIIQWDLEKKKLTVMESKLKELRSEDLRTADALDEISKDLG